MNYQKLSATSLALALTLTSANSFANEVSTLPTIVVKEKADEDSNQQYQIPLNFPGSASYVSEKTIEEKQTNDINRLIREIPGVNLQEEDGYGLRPNIGLRGGRNERSADITLMEDGVLIAPAPYASSSAYYFPSMGRVQGIEVRKGSSSIKYGPRTTSGVLNLLTTPIPESSKGRFKTSMGSFDEKNFNFNYGDMKENFGYVVNFDHSSSDGFKELDGGGDTGYELTDFMGKFRLKTDDDADIYQHLELKLAVNDEVSDETYVGLTAEDFKDNPYRRYKASSLDQMNAEHRQYQLSHYIEPSDTFNVNTTIYRNEFKRNWYKVQSVEGEDLGDVFNTNDANRLGILKGTVDGEFDVRANDRQYVSQGIQTRFKNKLKLGDVRHNLEYGARYHNDQELRFQNQDTYNMSAGQISLKTSGAPGGAGDRVAKASALSFFLEDEIIIDKLTIVPGARFEHITSKREDAGKAVRTNNTDVFIPGISASYLLTEKTAVFSGVHKGFAPPSPSNSSSAAEESINYEAGFRFKDKTKFFETVAFYNDYSNLLGSDTASGGGSGDGDQFNGGAVTAYGLEVVGGVDLKADILKQAVKFPLSLSYTYNHAEFGSSFDTKDTIKEWGKVQKGDELPYIAPHQFGLSAGLEVDKVSLYLSGKFVSAMRATAGSGSIPKSEKIPSHFVADFSGFYEFEKNRSIFVAVDNIFNNEYLVSLRPSGMRPGKPLAARVGVSIGF